MRPFGFFVPPRQPTDVFDWVAEAEGLRGSSRMEAAVHAHAHPLERFGRLVLGVRTSRRWSENGTQQPVEAFPREHQNWRLPLVFPGRDLPNNSMNLRTGRVAMALRRLFSYGREDGTQERTEGYPGHASRV